MKTETVQICPKCGSPGKFTYILHDSPEESSASANEGPGQVGLLQP